jgi:hypothetical protein
MEVSFSILISLVIGGKINLNKIFFPIISVLIPSSVFIKGSSNAKNGFPDIILEVISFTKINVVLKHTSSLQI